MKNAIAVGIGGLMLSVAWFFLWPAVPEQEKPEPMETAQVRSAAKSTPVQDGLLSNGLVAEEIYLQTCSTCHVAGLAAAPKFGSRKEWASRIAKGLDSLYRSAIEGIPPAMPAKGMCFDCSDDDLKAVVDYMVTHSQ